MMDIDCEFRTHAYDTGTDRNVSFLFKQTLKALYISLS